MPRKPAAKKNGMGESPAVIPAPAAAPAAAPADKVEKAVKAPKKAKAEPAEELKKVDSRFSPRIIDGQKYFSRADMLELQLAESRFEAAQSLASVKFSEAQEYQRQAQAKLEELSRAIEAARMDARKKGEELAALNKALGEAYGVDMSRVAYDDLTGRINMLP